VAEPVGLLHGRLQVGQAPLVAQRRPGQAAVAEGVGDDVAGADPLGLLQGPLQPAEGRLEAGLETVLGAEGAVAQGQGAAGL
jgi:hypothetical protein